MGWVVFAMPASGWLSQQYGAVFEGGIALLGMSASSAVVQTTAERGTDVAALDMKINFLRLVHRTGNSWLRPGRCYTAGTGSPSAGRGPPRRPARGRDHRHDRAGPGGT